MFRREIKMKKAFTLILVGVISILLCVPALASELPGDGKPLSPTAFDGAEYVPAEKVMIQDKSRQILLGYYTIKNYLNQGWMVTTDQSFGASDFPPSGTFEVITNMSTDGFLKTVKAGISYVNWAGEDEFFAYTKVDLAGVTTFTTTKAPDQNKKYYGGVLNETGGKMYGSFSIYAVYND